jgi:Cdc6-like AAA superfamily ATPase
VAGVSTGLSQMNRALNLIPKRAEQRQSDRLRETFLDSGVAVALEAIDHQVLYGRRGTGKTHALRYIESQIQARGDVAVYVDLRTIGSPEGLFMGDRVLPTERAARLLS